GAGAAPRRRAHGRAHARQRRQRAAHAAARDRRLLPDAARPLAPLQPGAARRAGLGGLARGAEPHDGRARGARRCGGALMVRLGLLAAGSGDLVRDAARLVGALLALVLVPVVLTVVAAA